MLWSMLPTVEIPEVPLLLRRFTIHRNRWIDTLCRHVGVSRSDYDALEALDEHGSLTPGELGTLLSLTSGSVTALIDRLERLGWASRNGHPEDRRKVVVTLTQRAWQVGQDELEAYLEAVDAAARQLSNDERAVVVGFLEDLIDKIAHAPRPQHGGE
jgi:DNA-binding MarR family transcriptional regulator